MKSAKFGPLMLALGLGAAVLLSAPARAALVVIPGSLAGAEQPAPDSSPLGADDTPQRFQMAYGPTLLGGLNVGDIITGLTFRVDAFPEGAHNTTMPAQTVANYEIGIGRSVNAAGSLSMTFEDNRDLDFVIARSGELIINAGDFPGGGSPNAFGAIIAFATPYAYIGGTLLIEIAHDGFPAGGRFVDDSAMGFPDAQQIFGFGFAATQADYGNESQAMPLQLQVTPGPDGQQLPEPSALNLFGAALASLMAVAVATCRQRRPVQARG